MATIFIDLLYLSHFPRNPITTHGNLSTLEKIRKIAKFLHFENRGKSEIASFSTKFQCHVENNDVVGLKL